MYTGPWTTKGSRLRVQASLCYAASRCGVPICLPRSQHDFSSAHVWMPRRQQHGVLHSRARPSASLSERERKPPASCHPFPRVVARPAARAPHALVFRRRRGRARPPRSGLIEHTQYTNPLRRARTQPVSDSVSDDCAVRGRTSVWAHYARQGLRVAQCTAEARLPRCETRQRRAHQHITNVHRHSAIMPTAIQKLPIWWSMRSNACVAHLTVR